MKIYSVSELNTEAREAMLLAFQYPITVKGEISDYRSSRGHQYFKLRDSSSSNTVSCVMWKGSLNSFDFSEYLHKEGGLGSFVVAWLLVTCTFVLFPCFLNSF